MSIFYFLHESGDVLGYEADDYAAARLQAAKTTNGDVLRHIGNPDGYPKPLPDEAVILVQEFIRLGRIT